MTTATRSAALLGLIALTGCAADMSSPVSTAGQVKRTIICREKPGVDPTTVLRLANDFSKVPGVLDVSAGRRLTGQPGAASPEAITFILSFRNSVDATKADDNSIYKRVRDEGLPAVATDIKSTDLTLENYLVSQQFTEETTAATRERRAAAIKQQTEMINRTK